MYNTITNLETELTELAALIAPISAFLEESRTLLSDARLAGADEPGQQQLLADTLGAVTRATVISANALGNANLRGKIDHFYGQVLNYQGAANTQVAANIKAARLAQEQRQAQVAAEKIAAAAAVTEQARVDAETLALRIRILGHA